MIAPLKRSIPEHDLLPDLRALLSLRPRLVKYPKTLATLLDINEHEVRALLEALAVEGEVLP